MKENSGVMALLARDEREHLSRLFRLYTRQGSGGLTAIATLFKEHIESVGTAIVRDGNNENSTRLVSQLLSQLNRFSTIVESCFQNHPAFQRSLKEAFTVFVNLFVTVGGKTVGLAELMSQYCDAVSEMLAGWADRVAVFASFPN